MPKTFISYLRVDMAAAATAGRLYDRLVLEFGPDKIFMDVDTLKAGSDYADVITRTVSECDALVAVIGECWLTVTDEQGNRRLENPRNWVRLEIETALNRDIQVIPALVCKTRMPRSIDLPEGLKKLGRKHAVEITHKNFHRDASRLIDDLGAKPELEMARVPGTPRFAAGPKTGKRRSRPPGMEDTWIDPDTRLMWTVEDNGEDIDWYEACRYAKSLLLAGYSDWRLPTIGELSGLAEEDEPWMGIELIPAVKEPIELTGLFVWSSTAEEGSAMAAWFDIPEYPACDLVPFEYSGGGRVLCVRQEESRQPDRAADPTGKRPGCPERPSQSIEPYPNRVEPPVQSEPNKRSRLCSAVP